MPLFKYCKKKKLPEYFTALFEIVTFLSKKKSSLWISPKMLQNNRKTWFSSICLTLWRKIFLVIFILYYWFVQKKLFKQIQIFLRIFPFSNMVRKTLWLSFSVLVSAIVTFMLKKKFSMNSPKILQNKRKA